MKLKNILTFFISLFIFVGCSSVEKTDQQEEREKKLNSLNEECDFATVENSFPEDIYICYKNPTRIKEKKSKEAKEEAETSAEENK